MTHHHKLPSSSHFNRMTSIFLAYNHPAFNTAGHTDIATTKMEIHIQFHGAKSTQNGLSPAMENHMEKCRDRLDKMIHRVQNRLGCQALLVYSVSSLLRPSILQRNIDQECFTLNVSWVTLISYFQFSDFGAGLKKGQFEHVCFTQWIKPQILGHIFICYS